MTLRRDETVALIDFKLGRAKDDGYLDKHPDIEAAINKLLVTIDNIEIAARTDMQLWDIVLSEAEAFRSAEETAANIQSRVSIYMPEQG